ncbi:MAG: glycosyltransferase family 2 protein [Cytophagales bacterium]
MNSLSIIILTFNEEKNIYACLEKASKLSNNILVIDSFSSDNTKNIAATFGAEFIQNKFISHTLQWKFALQNNPFESEWLLCLDADQVLSDDLIQEIKSKLAAPQIANGFYIKRKMYFLDKWIRFGGYYPLYLLKLFRKEAVYMDEGELMEHHFYVKGKTQKLKECLYENNQKETISFWVRKHVRYSELQAQEEFSKSKSETNRGSIWGNTNEKKLFIRKNIWERMPLFIRPFLYFFYRYFILLGFLDGIRGSIFHFLQAFFYRTLVDAQIYELKRKYVNNNK